MILAVLNNTCILFQLQSRHGCGFELSTWSNLPQGSGLGKPYLCLVIVGNLHDATGTSSILGGVVMAALSHAAGLQYDEPSLIHAVLHLEQMLV
jgi:hypothetical protein